MTINIIQFLIIITPLWIASLFSVYIVMKQKYVSMEVDRDYWEKDYMKLQQKLNKIKETLK